MHNIFTEIKDKVKDSYMGQESIKSPTRFEKNQIEPPAIKKKKQTNIKKLSILETKLYSIKDTS